MICTEELRSAKQFVSVSEAGCSVPFAYRALVVFALLVFSSKSVDLIDFHV